MQNANWIIVHSVVMTWSQHPRVDCFRFVVDIDFFGVIPRVDGACDGWSLNEDTLLDDPVPMRLSILLLDQRSRTCVAY